jgi:hypothetical protein
VPCLAPCTQPIASNTKLNATRRLLRHPGSVAPAAAPVVGVGEGGVDEPPRGTEPHRSSTRTWPGVGHPHLRKSVTGSSTRSSRAQLAVSENKRPRASGSSGTTTEPDDLLRRVQAQMRHTRTAGRWLGRMMAPGRWHVVRGDERAGSPSFPGCGFPVCQAGRRNLGIARPFDVEVAYVRVPECGWVAAARRPLRGRADRPRVAWLSVS